MVISVFWYSELTRSHNVNIQFWTQPERASGSKKRSWFIGSSTLKCLLFKTCLKFIFHSPVTNLDKPGKSNFLIWGLISRFFCEWICQVQVQSSSWAISSGRTHLFNYMPPAKVNGITFSSHLRIFQNPQSWTYMLVFS